MSVTSISVALHVSEVVLKSVEELSKNFILSLLTGLHLRVHLGIVRLTDIVDVELARSVDVHNLVDLLDDVLTEGVHFTADGTQELIVRDRTRAISIEEVIDLSSLLIGHTNTEVMHSLDELSLIELARSVVIGDFEFPTDGSNTTSTSLGKSSSEVVNELLLSGILRHESFLRGCSGRSSTEDVVGSGSLGSSRGKSFTFAAATDLAAPALGAHALTGLGGELPGVLDHELEVVVVIDGGRDVVIVLDELLLGDNIVRGTIVAHSMLSLESLKELLENLIFSLLASENFWVSISSVDALDVVNIDPTIVIFVENIVGLEDDLLSSRVHGAADGTNELVELKETSLVVIEVVEELLHLTLGETEHVIRASLSELELVERARVVVVHDLELSLEADEATGTTRDELLAHSFSELLRATHGRSTAGSGHRSTIERRGELLVLDATRGVEIVDVEESLKIL